MGVSTSFRSQSVSVLRHSSSEAGGSPGEEGVVDPSTPGEYDSADYLMVPDDDDPATPCGVVHSADAPVITNMIFIQ